MKLTHKHQPTRRLRGNQAGIASFLVTLILMLVITLIVIGFAQIARRNERRALDDQLSTQAFYASESGVNLVKSLLEAGTPVSQLNKSTCPATVPPYLSAQLSDAASNVYNSCLLVNTGPSVLVYSDIGPDSTVIPIESASGGGLGGHLKFEWQSKDETPGAITACLSNDPSQYSTFVHAGAWPSACPYGVFRFDLVDASASGIKVDAIDAVPAAVPSDALASAQTLTVFAPPSSNHAPIYRPTTPVSTTPGTVQCSGGVSGRCTLTVDNINYDHAYYLRVTSLYKDVAISGISGTTAAGDEVDFTGAQIAVDSTGKAVDLLRRVQVRLDQGAKHAPPFAIESTAGICKKYTVYPGYFGPNDPLACPTNN